MENKKSAKLVNIIEKRKIHLIIHYQTQASAILELKLQKLMVFQKLKLKLSNYQILFKILRKF